MPWREVKPMDQKVLFLADYLRGGASFAGLCARYGISRKTGYKWVQRYQQQGPEGLEEHSRRPVRSPHKTPYRVRQAIIALRGRGQEPLGPKKIQCLLRRQFSPALIPSKTTIYNLLKGEGLVSARGKRRRVPPSPQPFAPVGGPNALWSADYKGQFKTRDGCWCYPLTVMDHDSRFLLCVQGLEGTQFIDAQRTFRRVFREYGLPGRIRTDNGTPFASTASGGLSRLAIWWVRLGIYPERIAPGQPQQNGRHERMHRTLKRAVSLPPAATLKAQQRRFDAFCEDYNHHRPHEALDQCTPASRYTPSARPFPETLPAMVYPEYYEVREVRTTGVVYWRAGQVYISHLLRGELIGMEEVDDGIWAVYYGPIRLGGFNERHAKQGVVPYWSIKV